MTTCCCSPSQAIIASEPLTEEARALQLAVALPCPAVVPCRAVRPWLVVQRALKSCPLCPEPPALPSIALALPSIAVRQAEDWVPIEPGSMITVVPGSGQGESPPPRALFFSFLPPAASIDPALHSWLLTSLSDGAGQAATPRHSCGKCLSSSSSFECDRAPVPVPCLRSAVLCRAVRRHLGHHVAAQGQRRTHAAAHDHQALHRRPLRPRALGAGGG